MLKISNAQIRANHQTLFTGTNKENKARKTVLLVPVVALSMLPNMNSCSTIDPLERDTFELQDSLKRNSDPHDTTGIDIVVDTTYNEIIHEIVL